MTEPTPAHEAPPEDNQARIDWPGPPGGAAVGDPEVDVLVERLATLPELPVAAHGDFYAGLHDDLADALNEDVAGRPAGGSAQ